MAAQLDVKAGPGVTAGSDAASYSWPLGDLGGPALVEFRRAQHELLAAAARFGHETMLSVGNEIEVGGSILQRMVSAKTPEDLFACQRDMIELISSKYFEHVAKLSDRMQAVLSRNGSTAPRS